MKVRRITSLTASLAFILMVLTSIILYVAPQGRVAYWADWRLWGLTKSETSNKKPGVKVLSEKLHSEVLKMVDDFRKNEQANGSNDAANINLSKEFAEILSPGGYGMVN